MHTYMKCAFKWTITGLCLYITLKFSDQTGFNCNRSYYEEDPEYQTNCSLFEFFSASAEQERVFCQMSAFGGGSFFSVRFEVWIKVKSGKCSLSTAKI